MTAEVEGTAARKAAGNGFWSRHILAVIFAVLVIVHWIGVYSVTGDQYIFAINTFAVSVAATYVIAAFFLRGVFDRLTDLISQAGVATQQARGFLLALDLLVILFPVFYFWAAGYVPIVKMYFTTDFMVASEIRYNFFASLPSWQRYAGEYYIKGLVSLWLIFSYITKRRLFLLTFLAATVFSFAIVTKAYILIVFAPLLIVLISQKRWISSGLMFLFIAVLMMLSVIVQHKSSLLPKPPEAELPPATELSDMPSLRSAEVPKALRVSDADGKTLLVSFLWKPIEAIWLRAFSAIGVIEGQWLETYPSEAPFEGGCGYSWASKIADCKFVNLANKIWKKYYPDLEARGLNGTVTAADYVQAYANFGMIGIVASGAVIGIIIVLLGIAFPDPAIRVALNTLPLALTFESVLTTLLNSSGWGITIALGALLFASCPSAQDSGTPVAKASR